MQCPQLWVSLGFYWLDDPMMPAVCVSRLGIDDLCLRLHIRQQPWELTRLQPELSRASPHLPQPSLPSQPPSRNSLGWAFCSLVPRQCSWCCRLGRGGGRSRKSVGGSCLLVPKASKAVTAPSSPHDASPNSHTGVSANKANFFFTICS